jgi:hypothetical protein
MITSTSLIFSKSSVARILSIPASQIVKFVVYPYVCWVHVRGQRPKFMSRKPFYQHFAAHRQAQGQELRQQGKVSKISGTRYTIDSNSAESGFYMVELHPDRVACECQDYRNQLEYIGRGICKHGYAAIGQLGLTTLSDYLRAAEMAKRIAPIPRTIGRHTASAMAC